MINITQNVNSNNKKKRTEGVTFVSRQCTKLL
jgi:hypothetical protein